MAVHVVDHPLVKHKLGLLRDNATSTCEFRRVANELATLLTYEATRHLPVSRQVVQGWSGPVEVEELSGKSMTVVPILRAGLGLLDGVLAMIPSARISVIGLYRNETTLEPVEYYEKLAPDLADRLAIILDPMLATGGSFLAAINTLKKHGCRRIFGLNLVCAPEGVKRIMDAHPEIEIFTASIDEGLNDNGYILPGLGDAGDRIFGTR